MQEFEFEFEFARNSLLRLFVIFMNMNHGPLY